MMGIAQTVLVEIVRGHGQLAVLATLSDKPRGDVVKAVQRLKRRGLVAAVEPGLYAATEAGRAFVQAGHAVASGQGVKPRRRTRGLRQRAWWVLRVRGVVTIPDLLMTLADGAERDAHANLSKYLHALCRAGFVAEIGRSAGAAPTSNGHKRYKLVRNNGRQAPVVRQRQRTVFDPNSGDCFDLGGGRAP
jgi:hypothetical protein